MMKKKICLINPTILIKRPISELIDRLSDKYEIGLLCPHKIGKKIDTSLYHSDLIKKAKIYTYPTFQIPFIKSEWPIPLISFYFKIFKIFKEYDVVHMWVYFYLSSFWITFVKLFFPKKKLILTMDTVPSESFSMGKIMDFCFKIYHQIFGWFIFGVPNKITLYGKSLIPFAKKAGIKKEKIKIIPTGIDIDKFKGKYANIREEFGIKNDEILGLFVGLMVPRKGIDTIIKTIAKLRDEKFKMILVGAGPERKKYEKLVEENGLKDKIIFTGTRKDMKNFYRSVDLLFFPSRGEGLAGAIMEAMSVGLPILSSRIPCTTDLVKENFEKSLNSQNSLRELYLKPAKNKSYSKFSKDKENGYLCEIEEVDCYVTKLKKLIQDKELRDKMGLKSIELIKRFSWDDSVEGFEGVYE